MKHPLLIAPILSDGTLNQIERRLQHGAEAIRKWNGHDRFQGGLSLRQFAEQFATATTDLPHRRLGSRLQQPALLFRKIEQAETDLMVGVQGALERGWHASDQGWVGGVPPRFEVCDAVLSTEILKAAMFRRICTGTPLVLVAEGMGASTIDW